MVVDKKYPGILPAELAPYHAYVMDGGHSIMRVPDEAIKSGAPWRYEAPVPVKYVLSCPREILDGYVYIDVTYDPMLGVTVNEGYYEF